MGPELGLILNQLRQESGIRKQDRRLTCPAAGEGQAGRETVAKEERREITVIDPIQHLNSRPVQSWKGTMIINWGFHRHQFADGEWMKAGDKPV